jgi:dienelactone hydrolase
MDEEMISTPEASDRSRIASVGACLLLLSLLFGCGGAVPDLPAPQTLEHAAAAGTTELLLENARADARAQLTTLEEIGATLRPYDRIYRPRGEGPFPAVLLFHGCSGSTLSHEEDWANFYNALGIAVFAVDSITPRGLDWQQVCDLRILTGRERASDVLASLEYVRELDYIDSQKLALSGFSHGAWTIWELLGLAGREQNPLNLAEWPQRGLEGVRATFLFYGPCLENWNVPIPTIAFLAENDRYIDEQTCIDARARNEENSEFLSVVIFASATHTFDHARPNAANRAAGSVYDAEATRAARLEIARRLGELFAPEERAH